MRARVVRADGRDHHVRLAVAVQIADRDSRNLQEGCRPIDRRRLKARAAVAQQHRHARVRPDLAPRDDVERAVSVQVRQRQHPVRRVIVLREKVKSRIEQERSHGCGLPENSHVVSHVEVVSRA